MTAENSKTVGLVLYEGCTLLDFVGATQVFASWASGWNPIWLTPEPANPDKNYAPIRTSENLSVVPSHSFEDVADLRVVLVPGGTGAGVAATMADSTYLDFLCREADGAETWVGAVCVGTFIVAAAGLLKGLEATTHWRLVETLRAMGKSENYAMTVPRGFPRSVIDRKNRRFTGGGVSASIDVALALVKELSDPDPEKSLRIANTAGLSIQYEPMLPEGVARGNPLDHQLDGITETTAENMSEYFAGPINRAVKELVG